jgi:hypothetical protein
MTDEEWDAKCARVRAEIAPVAVVEGRWIGRGQAHGEPLRGELRIRRVLGDSMVEVWERVGDHEDLCFYRYDVDTKQLRVLHLMDGAVVAEHPIETTSDGLVWVTPPDQPAVEWRFDGTDLRCDVVWPGRRVAEVSMRYTRAATE